jgi:redox-regulated HSP33 family molecular chaperone
MIGPVGVETDALQRFVFERARVRGELVPVEEMAR